MEQIIFFYKYRIKNGANYFLYKYSLPVILKNERVANTSMAELFLFHENLCCGYSLEVPR